MTEPLVIVGCGGHSRELADVVQACIDDGATWELIGFIDDNAELWGQEIRGIPVLGGLSWFQHDPHMHVVVGIGAPTLKRHIVQRLSDYSLRFPNLIHPRAEVTRYIRWGHGVVVTAGCVLTNNIVLGNHVHLNRMSTVGHDCDLGDYVHLAPGAVLSGNVRVGEGCDIGTHACVIQNLNIGDWTIVGAGAAVIHDLPDHVTAVGVPARVLRPPMAPDS